MHSLSIWVLSLLFFLCSLLLLKTKKNVEIQHKKKLGIVSPPGPPKLPFLGHLHLILGSHPHRSLRKLASKYGPIMLLQFGSIPTVVISSAAAARELFKLHDLASCSRPLLAANRRFSYNFLDIIFSPYGDRWRELRKICIVELFSAKRVQSFQKIREEEVNLLMSSIYQSSCSSTRPVDLKEKSYSVTANIMTQVAFGKSFRGSKLDNEKFQGLFQRASEVLGSFSVTDFFPTFGWIIDWVTGVHGRIERSFAELDAFLDHVVEDRINFLGGSHKEENITDVLLRMERENSLIFTANCIKAAIMDIFLAGVETSANVIVWVMTELVRNSKVMKKLQDEIRNCIKEDRVKESDLKKLQYLKMVVKEVLRLHAPVPLILPRETMSHFKINGYDIDPKTHVHVNVWAIGRDPEYWTNPLEFRPERFMESNIDYKGHHFELLPFGSGRRICPGLNMGIATVELTLANMLLRFGWKLPNGMKEEDVDIEEHFGVTVTKKSPLQLLPIPYLNSI